MARMPLLVLLLLAALVLPACAEQDALDRSLESAAEATDAPGAGAAVVKDGKVVWAGAVGRTSAARGAGPVTTDTGFITASAGKTVTAALVLEAARRGELTLDERLSDFYPRLRGAQDITLTQLLAHTSGLPDYLENHEFVDTGRPPPRDQVVATIPDERRAPGRYAYANTNYVLLGGVLEKATGEGIETQYVERLARPLGLRHSSWLFAPTRGDIALPHVGGEPKKRLTADYWGEVWTDGGLMSSASDLALIANEVVLRRGQKAGQGLYGESFAGRRWIGHSGFYDGYSAEEWTDRAAGLTIVVLANEGDPDSDDDAPATTITARLARTVAGELG